LTRYLVFDWGDTVMETFPAYSGAMSDWPKVAAVKGISEALKELSKDYRCVIGTNAQDSNAAQIRAALDRVQVGQYFSEIFTYGELGARKPDSAFYRGIESKLGGAREEYMMIGDSYAVDVLGAWRAGWKSAWYNPFRTSSPGLMPVHELQIHDMAFFPEMLRAPELPSLKTCLQWLQTNQVSSNLFIHVQLVAGCAYQMALWLNRNGIMVNPILAHRGGLLHDLAKLWTDGKLDHGLAASQWLSARGEDQLAEIAYRHMLFGIMDKARCPRSWEEKLVYLADKLVEKNTIVSIDERIAGLKSRYSMDEHLMQQTYPLLLDLQKEVCTAARIQENELSVKLAQAIFKN
jgi:putative hydrolase of the HAD superfamily